MPPKQTPDFVGRYTKVIMETPTPCRGGCGRGIKGTENALYWDSLALGNNGPFCSRECIQAYCHNEMARAKTLVDALEAERSHIDGALVGQESDVAARIRTVRGRGR